MRAFQSSLYDKRDNFGFGMVNFNRPPLFAAIFTGLSSDYAKCCLSDSPDMTGYTLNLTVCVSVGVWPHHEKLTLPVYLCSYLGFPRVSM